MVFLGWQFFPEKVTTLLAVNQPLERLTLQAEKSELWPPALGRGTTPKSVCSAMQSPLPHHISTDRTQQKQHQHKSVHELQAMPL
jgi:hypothetical protein